MKKAVDDFLVIENTTLNHSNYLLRLKSPRPLPVFQPGQFINAEVKNSQDVFLRRPFSVFEVDYNRHSISLIIKILGKGSYQLSLSRVGDTINLVYPLGKGFTLPGINDKILLVGGGSGLAPLLFLARESGIPSHLIDIVLGARSVNDHFDVDNYSQFGNICFTTEDGSLGTKGVVTQDPRITVGIERYDRIYTCGPLPMMKAVAKLAKKADVWCEVSLENLMACGFGVCLCCIEPTTHGNKCVCADGPVFNINELKWQI
jgi:dihydroorotate dehydrogenase electron transfer subunit